MTAVWIAVLLAYSALLVVGVVKGQWLLSLVALLMTASAFIYLIAADKD